MASFVTQSLGEVPHEAALAGLVYPLHEYMYCPLGDNEIRVMDLLGEPGRPLRCRLRNVRLGAAGYTALSYVWGGDRKPHTLQVIAGQGDGPVGTLHLTDSLQNALQDLRDCQDIQPKTFWIDQLCINQNDKIERGRQVKRMRDIYKLASRVVTYLGPGEEGDRASLDLAMRIYKHYKSPARFVELWDVYARPLDHVDKFKYDTSWSRFPFGEADASAYEHLAKQIISTSWTERLWIVQENVANRNADFLRGPRSVPWDCIGLLCAFSMVGIIPDILCDANVCDIHQRRVTSFVGQRGRHTTGSHIARSDSLYGVVQHFATTRECKDQRDKIYAVLGLAQDAQDLAVVPDYEKSPQQVFTDLAVAYMLASDGSSSELHGLGVLTWTDPVWDQGVPALPCWVPRFADAPPSPKPRRMAAAGSNADVSLKLLSFEPSEVMENSVLVTRGIRLGLLEKQYDRYALLSLAGPHLHDSAPKTLGIFEGIESHLGGGSQAQAAICQTIIMQSNWPSDPETRVEKAALAFRNIKEVLRNAINGANIAHREQPGVSYASVSSLDGDTGLAEYVFDNEVIDGRSLWLTERGHLALVPRCAEDGDLLVVLFGGPWIYVLRPFIDANGTISFKYVGYGYVHGYMDGEAHQEEGWEDNLEVFKIL